MAPRPAHTRVLRPSVPTGSFFPLVSTVQCLARTARPATSPGSPPLPTPQSSQLISVRGEDLLVTQGDGTAPGAGRTAPDPTKVGPPPRSSWSRINPAAWAGQGVELWKASADGSTGRCAGDSGRRRTLRSRSKTSKLYNPSRSRTLSDLPGPTGKKNPRPPTWSGCRPGALGRAAVRRSSACPAPRSHPSYTARRPTV